MRSRFKLAALLAAFAVLFTAGATAVQAAPTGPSTSWNNGKGNRYPATLIGKPPFSVAHRVSVNDTDFYGLARAGEAELYAVEYLDFDVPGGPQALFPTGSTINSVGTSASHVIGSNANGKIWSATVYVYVRSSPLHGTAYKFTYTVTPYGSLTVGAEKTAGPILVQY